MQCIRYTSIPSIKRTERWQKEVTHQTGPTFRAIWLVDVTFAAGNLPQVVRKVGPVRCVGQRYLLRTGHAPLAKHLHRIGKVESPRCPCCRQEEETVHHYLIWCPAHREARCTMIREAGTAASSLTDLLLQCTLLPALFKFIAASGRLQSVFGQYKPVENMEEV
ncbi:hypothetical protein CPB84DRAFT_791922 [Gymnopilus junonius]|uniref:Reverse transcriptase zinc-binding domain-containing protein n=1 Tax=Gymnopilus junonius TaxID=109634 RepID=A0A9P5TGB9_GYMJU|nr:hypothetical protein CPB84DRAFT_791922 [Gymnopilus junonius]